MKKNCRYGGWIGFCCAALILVAGCSNQYRQAGPGEAGSIQEQGDEAVAENRLALENQPVQPSRINLFLTSADKDLHELPGIVIDETVDIARDWDNLWPLLAAGGASIIMHNTSADREIAENFDLHRALGREVDEIVANIGGPGVHFGASGLWYAIAAGNQDEISKQRAWTMLKALSVTGTATLGLKLIRNNRTPNDKWLGWPSGHTASSFTVAAVLDELYGPKIGFPAYLGAGFVGYRMMDSSDHWASDVVFGAVLGWIVGHHIGREHKELELAGFKVIPYTDFDGRRSVMGVNFVKRF